MDDDNRKPGAAVAKVRWSPETFEEAIRERTCATIEAVLEEELEAALGARPSARVGEQLRGDRPGGPTRVLATSVGPTRVDVLRTRLITEAGRTEWHSETLPRY
jgi:transposase-like protein